MMNGKFVCRAVTAGLVLAMLAPFSAHAQSVRLKGFFIAEQACEATRKKDRDNPGDVRLSKKRAYELLGRNATPGTHYQIRIPGVPGTDIRWVAMTCGVYASKKDGAGATGGSTTGADDGKTPTKPDSPRPTDIKIMPGLKRNSLEHVLAANWQPGFCRTQPNRRECRDMTSRRHDASHFSLHGLWPDDLDDRAIFPCYCNSKRARSCSLKLGSVDRVPLSDSIRAQLRKAMPGMRSGLHKHEWAKHGTCYEKDRTDADHGADADEYFSETLGLLEQLNRSGVRALFARSIGQELTAREIGRAFDKSFGAGAGDRVIVRCSRVDGIEIITELWISVGAGITPDSRLSDLIRKAPRSSVSSGARRCREGLVAGAPR